MPLEYVIITPARNEAAFIEKTIASVRAQTVRPKRWVIVSDGSTDGTDEIVQRHQAQCDWIELVRLPVSRERNFAAKVHAFNAGLARLKDLPFAVIGNLDADVSFGADFIEFLLGRFAAMPELGVAGTHYVEGSFHSFRDSYINVHHVNGQCQFFRRECYEQIGGYTPIKGGGIDWAAVTTARMKGWLTYSFSEREFHHHRKMSSAGRGEIQALLHTGRKDYILGGHPLWQIARGGFQVTKRPYVIGGACLLLAYFSCWIRRVPRAVSPELMSFHRREQLERLKRLLPWRGGLKR
jgi:GT2 family glycosyltransferase